MAEVFPTDDSRDSKMPRRNRRVYEIEANRSEYEESMRELANALGELPAAEEINSETAQGVLAALGFSGNRESNRGNPDLYYFLADTIRRGFVADGDNAFTRNEKYLAKLGKIRQFAVEVDPDLQHRPHSEYDSNEEAQRTDVFLYALAKTLRRGEIPYLNAIQVSEYMRRWLNDPLFVQLDKQTKRKNRHKQKSSDTTTELTYIQTPYAQYELQEMFGEAFDLLSQPDKEDLVQFSKQLKRDDMERIYSFARHYGKNGLRALFAFSNDTGNLKALWYGEMFAHRDTNYVTKGIFENYAEIVDQSRKISQMVADTFPNASRESVKLLEKRIRARATKFLNTELDNTLEGSLYGKTYRQLEEERKRFKTDKYELVEIFKTLREKGIARSVHDFEQLQDISFGSMEATKFSKTDVDKMVSIIKRNWANEKPQFLNKILTSFFNSIQNPKSTFYVLRYKGNIVGFNKFDDNTDSETPHIYFGSFNVDPDFGNGKVGEVIYLESMKQEFRRGIPIHADCDPVKGITSTYIESGFVATELKEYEGKPSFHIVLNNNSNEKFVSKSLSQKEIIKKAKSNEVSGGESVEFLVTSELPHFEDFFSKGYVLTRLVYLKGGQIVSVFEKNGEQFQG